MKFDHVIGNPPYGSKSQKFLWLRFTEKAVEHAKEKITFIIPYNDKGKQAKKFIEERKIFQSEDISHYFNVGQPNIRIVVMSPTPIRKYVRKKIDPFKDYQNPYPNRKTMGDIFNGRIYTGFQKQMDAKFGDEYIGRQNKECEVLINPSRKGEIWKTISKELYDEFSSTDKGQIMLNSGWLYCIDGLMYGCKINATTIRPALVSYHCRIVIPFNDKTQAQELDKWMKSDEIVAELRKLHRMRIKPTGNKGGFTLSHKMFKLLPWYE